MLELTLQILSPPQGQGDSTEGPHSIIKWLILPEISPHPYVGSKSHFLNMTHNTFVALITREIPRVLRALPEKTKMFFLLCVTIFYILYLFILAHLLLVSIVNQEMNIYPKFLS